MADKLKKARKELKELNELYNKGRISDKETRQRILEEKIELFKKTYEKGE